MKNKLTPMTMQEARLDEFGRIVIEDETLLSLVTGAYENVAMNTLVNGGCSDGNCNTSNADCTNRSC